MRSNHIGPTLIFRIDQIHTAYILRLQSTSMDSRQRLLILIGAIACIGFAFIDIYISAFVAVIVGILYMMIWIMQDSAYLPHVVCSLS